MIAKAEIDFSEAEFSEASVRPLPDLLMPIREIETLCTAGDGFIVCVTEDAGSPVGMLCVGLGGRFGVHLALEAATLRSLGASALRAADLIDQGKGKQ